MLLNKKKELSYFVNMFFIFSILFYSAKNSLSAQQTNPTQIKITNEASSSFLEEPIPPLFPEVEDWLSSTRYFRSVNPELRNACIDYATFQLLSPEILVDKKNPLSFYARLKKFIRTFEKTAIIATDATQLYTLLTNTMYEDPFIIRDAIPRLDRIFKRLGTNPIVLPDLIKKLSEKLLNLDTDNEIIIELYSALIRLFEAIQ